MGKAEGEAGYAPAADTKGLSRKGDWSWTGREFVQRADSRPTRLSRSTCEVPERRRAGVALGDCLLCDTRPLADRGRRRAGLAPACARPERGSRGRQVASACGGFPGIVEGSEANDEGAGLAFAERVDGACDACEFPAFAGFLLRQPCLFGLRAPKAADSAFYARCRGVRPSSAGECVGRSANLGMAGR